MRKVDGIKYYDCYELSCRIGLPMTRLKQLVKSGDIKSTKFDVAFGGKKIYISEREISNIYAYFQQRCEYCDKLIIEYHGKRKFCCSKCRQQSYYQKVSLGNTKPVVKKKNTFVRSQEFNDRWDALFNQKPREDVLYVPQERMVLK